LGLYSLAIRLDALNGYYGVQKRNDGKKGSVFWFEIPYRPDEYCASNYHSDIFRCNSNSNRSTLEQTVMHTPLGNSSRKAEVRFGSPLGSPEITCEMKHSPPKNNPIMLSNVSAKTSGWNILVVDDSPTIAKMISMMLKQHNHKVTIAENGEIAVQNLLNHWRDYQIGYDIVLMDLQMPVMDGLEATRRCREYEIHQNMSHQIILGMSANSDHETMEDALHAGMDDFATKPFRIDTFHQKAMKLKLQLQQQ